MSLLIREPGELCAPRATDELRQQVAQLALRGVDVRLEPVVDPDALDPTEQIQIDRAITSIENRTNRAMAQGKPNPELFYTPGATRVPAINVGVKGQLGLPNIPEVPGTNFYHRRPRGNGSWKELLMSAAALHPLYHPNNETLGQGIEGPAFVADVITRVTSDGKQYGKQNALGLLDQEVKEARDPSEAALLEANHSAMLENYLNYREVTIDPLSRAFFKGCMDGKAIRTRAVAASELVRKHFSDRQPEDMQDMRSLSLACGAAKPVYNLVHDLEQRGARFSEIILADQDPLALASAYSLADKEMREKIALYKADLIRVSPKQFVKEKSVDVVDILGFFEYCKPGAAKIILKQAREVVRPGGVIVFGNMVDSRPQQTFFEKGVMWPPLRQRSLEETLAIVEAAGFSSDDVEVVIPENEGVYAVYAIKIPQSQDSAGIPKQEQRPVSSIA